MRFIKKFVMLFVLSLPTFAQNPYQREIFFADAGANDTYVGSAGTAPASYVVGRHYSFKANTANTGSASINFNSLGAKTIKKAAGGVTTDLDTNDIRAGQIVDLVYDGTNMQMQSTLGNAGSGSATPYVMTPGFGNWVAPEIVQSTVRLGSPMSDQHPYIYQFSVRGSSIVFNTLAFELGVASGTCGGTCHARWAIYAADGSTKLCDSGSLESGGAGTTNINLGDTNVVAATCDLTLAPAFYWYVYCTDSTALNTYTPGFGAYSIANMSWSAAKSPPGVAKAGMSSSTCGGGGGSALTMPANIGTLTENLDAAKGPAFWLYTI